MPWIDAPHEYFYIVALVVFVLTSLGIFVRRQELDAFRIEREKAFSELKTQRALDCASSEKEKAQIYLKFGEYMSRQETMSLLGSVRTEMHEIQNDIKEILIRLPKEGG